jgi:hypothetical protein
MAKIEKLMIYRIYNYEERYGFSAVRTDRHKDRKDSFEERPPLFVKKYIGQGHDDDTINLCKQMKMLKSCENYDTLNTIYDELLACAAFQVKWCRGYLFDGLKRPADIKAISRMIERPLDQLISAIETLIEIGLIEHVYVADVWRTCGKTAAKKWQALINNGNGIISNVKRQTGNGKTPKKNKTAKSRNNKAAKRSRKGKPRTEAAKKSRSRKAETESRNPKPSEDGNRQSQGHQEEQSANTTMPMPNMPTETELSQDEKLSAAFGLHSDSPGKSDTASEAALIRNEEDFARYARQLAPVELKFADEIYAALRCVNEHGPADKWPGLREYVTFIEAMRRAVKAGLGVNALNALSEASIKEAKRLGKQRFTKTWTKSCEACWMSTFNKRLLAYKSKKVQRSEGSG